MFRTMFLSVAMAITFLLTDAQVSEARVISRGNPGKYYNVSGMTYASMRWEQKRGNRRGLFGRSRRSFSRRR